MESEAMSGARFLFCLGAIFLLVVVRQSAASFISGPLGEDHLGLFTDDGTYGDAGPLVAHDELTPGPLVFDSGEVVTLYAGPDAAREEVFALLLVISADSADVATLGNIFVNFL